MVDKNGFWVGVIFISFCSLISLFAIFKTEKAVNLATKYFKWSLKIYGFEGDIKPTLRAKSICRNWNIFMFSIFFIVLIFLIFFAPR